MTDMLGYLWIWWLCSGDCQQCGYIPLWLQMSLYICKHIHLYNIYIYDTIHTSTMAFFQLFPQLRSEAKRPPALTWFGTCLPRRSRRWPRGPRGCGSSSGTRRGWPWSRGPSAAWTQKPRENQGKNGGNPRKNWENWENHRKIKGNPRKSWRIGDFDSGLKWSLSWVLMHTFRNQTWLGNPLWKWWIYVEGYSPWVSLKS